MNLKIIAMNLIIPLLAILVIAIVTGSFGAKKKESIKSELFEYFVKVWKTEEKQSDSESFFQKFFRMFLQTYEYEKYKETSNQTKYYSFKLLVLSVILCIPFLALILITSKEWLLNDGEWNNIYLYTVILVPLLFAYLINQYIKIKQYRETWYRHLRNRHHMEWRMIEFVKDYELLKAGKKTNENIDSVESLKIRFINDLCEYWKTTSTEIAAGKEENIFEEFGGLFGK